MDLEAYHRERHTNQLPTAKDRRAYADKMADRLESAATALVKLALHLRADPDRMLAHAFTPSMLGMYTNCIGVVTTDCFPDHIAVKSRMIFGELSNEIGFRAVVSKEDPQPTMDDSMG
jgi:hypothetical protein